MECVIGLLQTDPAVYNQIIELQLREGQDLSEELRKGVFLKYTDLDPEVYLFCSFFKNFSGHFWCLSYLKQGERNGIVC